MPYHTYLDLVVEPIKDQIVDFNWLISDIEMWSDIDAEPPIDMKSDYFILPPSQFAILLSKHVQFYWGVFLAIPITTELNLTEDNLPFVEGNGLIWENGNLQHPNAQIEIDCFDSGYTIVKFANESLSNRFKIYFGDDAMHLNDFNKIK